MQQSVYSFLREMLTHAFTKAFPELSPQTDNIQFSAILPDRSADLATPFLLKISQLYSIPLQDIYYKLVYYLEWNTNYIHDNKQNIYNNGFLNFRLSDKYIFSSVYNIGTTITCQKDQTTICKYSKNSIIQILFKVSQQHISSTTSLSYESLNWTLLDSIEERQIMRTIAISDPLDLHSKNAVEYFQQRLITETMLYYCKYPIITNNHTHTSMRLLLISALCNRLQSFINCSHNGSPTIA